VFFMSYTIAPAMRTNITGAQQPRQRPQGEKRGK